MLTKSSFLGIAAAAFAMLPVTAMAESPTVKQIKDRGTLLCSGHNGSYFGLVEVNDKNEWKRLDIDLAGR